MTQPPLITWPDPPMELIGFLAVFLGAGAVGFRFWVLAGPRRSSSEEERSFARGAERRAALLGLLGLAVQAALVCQRLPAAAARRHMDVMTLVTGQLPIALQLGLLAVALIGFLIATAGHSVGWWLAAIGVVVSPLRSALLGQFARITNPTHEVAGGLWIGTLFFMVALGIAPALRGPMPSERRSALVERMVRGFSPLALSITPVLVFFGVNTSWRHLKKLEALWTTPYGYALMAKLVVVAGVFVLGAWNWRRQKPKLGTEAGAIAIRRSATGELLLAGLVLLITSVLVSLPSPE